MQQIAGIINAQPLGAEKGIQADQQNTALFSNLSAGDTVCAEVIAVSGKDVTLEMPDGREIKARFPEGVLVRQGDLLALTMVGKGPDMVHLKLNAVNGQTVTLESSQLQVYLMEMGLPPSKANEAATQLLMHYHIEPTPEKITSLLQVAEKLPELPAFLAAVMVTNKIPPTQENAEILMKWGTGPAALGKTVTEIGNLFAQTLSTQLTDSFRDAVLRQASPQQMAICREAEFDLLAVHLGALQQNDEKAAQSIIHSFVDQAQLPEGEKQGFEAILMNGLRTARTIENAGKSILQSAGKAETEPDKSGTTQTVIPEPGKYPSMHGGGTEGLQTKAFQEYGEIGKVLDMLNSLFAEIKGKDIGTDAQALHDTVHKQGKTAEMLRDAAVRLMGEASPAAQKVNDLNAQVRLGNQMEHFYYCQIPYESWRRKGTVELYVFERKRRQAAGDRDNVTVLIGLDTQNMGRLETLLHAEGNKLSIEFRVEGDNIKRFFAENTEELAMQMQTDGFDLAKISVTKIKEPVTPLNVLEILGREDEVKIAGIDIQV